MPQIFVPIRPCGLVWNPYKVSGGTCVDPTRSLAAHVGLCSFRSKAEKKAKRIREQKSREDQVIPHQEHDGHMPLIHYESKRPRNNLDNADMLQEQEGKETKERVRCNRD